jgi:hypothetical protein
LNISLSITKNHWHGAGGWESGRKDWGFEPRGVKGKADLGAGLNEEAGTFTRERTWCLKENLVPDAQAKNRQDDL